VSEEHGSESGAAGTGESRDPLLETLWSRVLEAWDEDKPHHALLEYAIRAQKLPDVAALYRTTKERDPARAERAQKKLDGIVIAATQMLMAMKTSPERTKVPLPVTLTAFAVSLFLLSWLTYLVFHRT
jgi:hypothetical protein